MGTRDEGQVRSLRKGEEQDEHHHDGPALGLDTVGGNAHLVEVIALNTLKEIIKLVKERLEEEEGPFVLPSRVYDNLLVKCERTLLNYGEAEAKKVMRTEIILYLGSRRRFKERDDERKVKERLPSDTRRV